MVVPRLLEKELRHRLMDEKVNINPGFSDFIIL